ncbi:regulation of choline O-acetyltransferase protein, partial [Trichomonas vaginalis G3]|uniref:regulation of choline O-acetyltransferase protein n=1 Tax=Trichomonas vaginalis (strain ATCC PRA-98 / G3) TaxID=412133 RepID=UPI0021E57380
MFVLRDRLFFHQQCIYYHKCGTYTCDGYKSFTIQVNKDNIGRQWESVTCTKENATKEFSLPLGYYPRKVSCVDPERFCRSVKLNEMKFVVDPFDPNSKQLSSDSPTPTAPESGGYENPTIYGRNDDQPESGGDGKESSGGNSKGREAKQNAKKIIIISTCSAAAALIVIAVIVAFAVYSAKKAKENAQNEEP